MTKRLFTFAIFPDLYAITKLPYDAPEPDWAQKGLFVSLTRTPHELSIVCAQDQVPSEYNRETGWRVLRIMGPLDFTMVGVIAEIAAALSESGIAIFVISTFETDYILIRDSDLVGAVQTLRREGHGVEAL